MNAAISLAPGKVNLCLFLGPTRDDGRHELVSVMQAVSLADRVVLRDGGGELERDVVSCQGVSEPNLALAALARFRAATGWDAPPQRIEIDKAIPIAAGMAGGSADAAAVLRLAAAAAGVRDEPLLARIAFSLGADVPSQLAPGTTLVTGAGEGVEALAPQRCGVLVLPSAQRLSTAAVFAEADRLGLPGSARALELRLGAVREALGAGGSLPPELLVNELEPAALSLMPEIGAALAAARDAGAATALVSGSGPTVFGLFAGAEGERQARDAAASLPARLPAAVAAVGVGADFARVVSL